MTDILDKLRGGDLRSIGRANEVAQEVVHSPDLLASVFAGLLDNDPVVRMRAADAVEKASTRRPALLQPFKRELLGRVGASEQKEVRWHVALMLPRLGLNSRERRQAVAILLNYLEDTSSIVKTFAMQGLADLALHDAPLRNQVLPILQHLTEIGTAAMRSRGRKLLRLLNAEQSSPAKAARKKPTSRR